MRALDEVSRAFWIERKSQTKSACQASESRTGRESQTSRRNSDWQKEKVRLAEGKGIVRLAERESQAGRR
jgi:hypothetical protein